MYFSGLLLIARAVSTQAELFDWLAVVSSLSLCQNYPVALRVLAVAHLPLELLCSAEESCRLKSQVGRFFLLVELQEASFYYAVSLRQRCPTRLWEV